MKNNRDNEILERIINYCNEIGEANSQFGNNFEILDSKSVYKNSVAMCILQIGELTTHLSEEFKVKYNEMPWRDIKDMRNIVVHKYGALDTEILWDTMENDIPNLREYCEKIFESVVEE
ncbi:MAG: DUF86 domain-containing protein [Oscillospiraceae bacterium]|nr:DUF86 domain-containing protein [Oscillospiraceae bacterium]